MALTKRDVFFFLEQLCEQTNSFVEYQYKKQFGIFRNFKIRRGNLKLTSYVLQSLISPFEISRIVEIYSLIGQSLCSYSISPLSCLYTVYDVKSLNTLFEDCKNDIISSLDSSIVVLNTLSKSNDEGISCLIDYTITKQ